MSGAGHDGVAAAADAVAGFQHDHREAGVFQRMRGAEAGGARTDDGDIDFGGKGHERDGLRRAFFSLAPLAGRGSG